MARHSQASSRSKARTFQSYTYMIDTTRDTRDSIVVGISPVG